MPELGDRVLPAPPARVRVVRVMDSRPEHVFRLRLVANQEAGDPSVGFWRHLLNLRERDRVVDSISRAVRAHASGERVGVTNQVILAVAAAAPNPERLVDLLDVLGVVRHIARMSEGEKYVPWRIGESGRPANRDRPPGRSPLGRRTGPTLGVVRIGHHSVMAERGPLPGRWLIGMSAWVIQDGNYADFSVGQRAEFAIEFYAAEQLRAGAGPAAPLVAGRRPVRDLGDRNNGPRGSLGN